jgi:hypothetical protein
MVSKEARQRLDLGSQVELSNVSLLPQNKGQYRQLLGDSEFLGNVSSSKEHLIEQYNKAIETWIDEQKVQEAGQPRPSHS